MVWFETAKGRQVDYYFVRGAPVVAVLGVTIDKKIVLVKQYRPSTGKYMTDIPGGGAEDNESKKQAAKREFKEETGYDLDKVRKLTSFYFDSGRSDKYSTIYVGLATHKTDPKHDEIESLKIIEVPYKILMESIRSGKITEPTIRLSVMSFELSPLKKLYI